MHSTHNYISDPWCQILTFNGVNFNPLMATEEQCTKALKLAQTFISENRKLFGELYDFDNHPDQICEDDPWASLHYYVKSKGRTTYKRDQRIEQWDFQSNVDTGKRALSLTAGEQSLSLLEPMQKIHKATAAAPRVKVENPVMEKLKKACQSFQQLHLTRSNFVSSDCPLKPRIYRGFMYDKYQCWSRFLAAARRPCIILY